MSSSARYDVGYDVAQGVLLFFNVGLLVATLLQLLVEYRVSQDLRLYQICSLKFSVQEWFASFIPVCCATEARVYVQGPILVVGDKKYHDRAEYTGTSSTDREVSRSRSALDRGPRPHTHVPGPPLIGRLQYWFHRSILVAECVIVVWLVDPFGFHGLMASKNSLFFSNCVNSIIVALACYVLYTWLHVHYISAMQVEPRWLVPVLRALSVSECVFLLSIGVVMVSSDYRAWITAAGFTSLAVCAAVMLSVMTVSVLQLRGVLADVATHNRAAVATAERRMVAFMISLLVLGSLAIVAVAYGAYDRFTHPDSFDEGYPSRWSFRSTQAVLYASIHYCTLVCFFVYAYMPVSLLYRRPWAVLWEGQRPHRRTLQPTPSASNTPLATAFASDNSDHPTPDAGDDTSKSHIAL